MALGGVHDAALSRAAAAGAREARRPARVALVRKRHRSGLGSASWTYLFTCDVSQPANCSRPRYVLMSMSSAAATSRIGTPAPRARSAAPAASPHALDDACQRGRSRSAAASLAASAVFAAAAAAASCARALLSPESALIGP